MARSVRTVSSSTTPVGTALRVASATVLLLLLASCSPAQGRAPRPIVAWSVAGDVLQLVVDTCHGDPRATVEETDDEVTVTIVSTRHDPGDACQDTVEVTLEAPLGSRTLVDGTSGHEPEPVEG